MDVRLSNDDLAATTGAITQSLQEVWTTLHETHCEVYCTTALTLQPFLLVFSRDSQCGFRETSQDSSKNFEFLRTMLFECY